jgi:1-acyl-sn-glycerol-3-phosphate acyltransferase
MFIIVLALFILLFNPCLYSCVTWNYSLMAFMGLLGYTNIIAFTVVFLVYMILPSSIVKEILLYFKDRIREIFKTRITETESNIRKTFQLNVQSPIPPKSINIWHPHGISGVTPVIHNGYRITSPEYKPTKGVVHYGYFMLPFIKDIIPLLNAIPSDEYSIRDTLQTESISITLGGVDEMRRGSPKDLQLVVRKRRGIFKIALEMGVPIVPILTYGEQEIFPESDLGILKMYNELMYDWFRFRIPFPTLNSVINWTRLSQTALEPIVSYTGKPIRTKKISNPTERQIKKLRDLYIQRLQDLFDETSPPGYTMTIL